MLKSKNRVIIQDDLATNERKGLAPSHATIYHERMKGRKVEQGKRQFRVRMAEMFPNNKGCDIMPSTESSTSAYLESSVSDLNEGQL